MRTRPMKTANSIAAPHIRHVKADEKSMKDDADADTGVGDNQWPARGG